MSKVGQKPVTIPSGVTVEVNNQIVTIKGAKGQLVHKMPKELSAIIENNTLTLSRSTDSKHEKTIHGLYRNMISNAIQGVSTGWNKRLEIVGTGFNVKMQGQSLTLKLGFSHPVIVKPVDGIQLTTEGNNIIIVSGYDKQLVGQIAHQIKTVRQPDAYKGKGVRYEGEQIRLKPGKKAKTA
ncbi:50S ribosomal protein L6 [soil metagenome]